MTSFANLSDLQNRVQDWLFGRADIVAQVPNFVPLFEAKANRALFCRQMETRVTVTLDPNVPEPEFVALPGDYQSMRRVRLINSLAATGLVKPRLRYKTPAQLDDLMEQNGSPPGAPEFFTIFAQEMEIYPFPDQAYQLEMVYRTLIPSIITNPSNWLLQLAPDAYLYGTLMEAAPYLHEDERIPVWANGLKEALDGLNLLEEKSQYAGPMTLQRRRGY